MDHAIFELRRYRLRPGRRDELIELFDREFVETQEVLGIQLPAEFRDVDDPNAFVWLRSFETMEARAVALNAFYDGPVWRAHGSDANATMLNSDNVLLLRSTGRRSIFPANRLVRAAVGTRETPSGVTVVTTCSLAPGNEEPFSDLFESHARAVIEAAGARIDATFVTLRRPNTFPRLPVREGDAVFVWFSTFADHASYDNYTKTIASSPDWADKVFPLLDQELWRPMEIARLMPTARSLSGW